MKIGEVAKLTGTTTRTIRYYEEIGLLGDAGADREAGRHRTYGDAEVERLREALRLKQLLGVSLDELRELLAAEEDRAALREEWHHGNPGKRRRREILDRALAHVERQSELLARRRDEIAAFERELDERRTRVKARMAELD
ncbi:MerR family transcriptional regulator [Baekduia sp. Peel2402]|uniref:MerR family transcriptional regulator n=1 Tax=Baekduia sp. Peel2402 TaxID=3458296 RepID=UPI00403E960C